MKERKPFATTTWAAPWTPVFLVRDVFTNLPGGVMTTTPVPRMLVCLDKAAFIRRQQQIATMEMPAPSPTIVPMEAARGPRTRLVGVTKTLTAGFYLKQVSAAEVIRALIIHARWTSGPSWSAHRMVMAVKKVGLAPRRQVSALEQKWRAMISSPARQTLVHSPKGVSMIGFPDARPGGIYARCLELPVT